MLNSSQLIAYIPTVRPEQSKNFFKDKLGLKLVEEDEFALVFDSNGVRLRIAKVEAFTPTRFTVLGWSVENIEQSITEFEENEVELEWFEGLDQDERGIFTFPDGDQVAWFKDPDGNILSITQFSSS